MPKIFINYRRGGTAAHAGRLFDRLQRDFGAPNIFMDVSAIRPGHDFREQIKGAVGSCDVLLVVIGRDWATCIDVQGKVRIRQTDDFVRLEVAGALDRKVLVIPVLVDRSELPREDELPLDLRPLLWRQAFELRDARWDADISTLCEAIRSSPAPSRPALDSWIGQRPSSKLAYAVAIGSFALVLGLAAAAQYALGRDEPHAKAPATVPASHSAAQPATAALAPASTAAATVQPGGSTAALPIAPAPKPHAPRRAAADSVLPTTPALPVTPTKSAPAAYAAQGPNLPCGPVPAWTPLATSSRSWTNSVFRSDVAFERRMQFLRGGPPCRSVAAAKRALDARKITTQEYDDTVWALKQRQAYQLKSEKQSLDRGATTAAEYQARVAAIKAEFTGP